MDAVFKALADNSRRQLLDRLYKQNGQSLNQLCRELSMSRQAVTKHLAVLRNANLVVPLWRGREKVHYLNPAPLRQLSTQWIDKYEQTCLSALADLEKALENIA